MSKRIMQQNYTERPWTEGQRSDGFRAETSAFVSDRSILIPTTRFYGLYLALGVASSSSPLVSALSTPCSVPTSL